MVLRYKIIVRADSNWDGIAYTRSVDVAGGGVWQTLRVPWSAFLPVFRARTLKEAGKELDPSSIFSVQL